MKHNLKPEVAKKVAKLLRSGEIQQTKYALRDYKPGKEKPCMCIQGAICETFRRETGRGFWFWREDSTAWNFSVGNERSQTFMTKEVLEWATKNAVTPCKVDGYLLSFMHMNDDLDTTFEEFADLLDPKSQIKTKKKRPQVKKRKRR